MTQPATQPTLTGQPKAARRSAVPALLTLAVLFAIVTSALAGCIVVPVGFGHEHERGYYRHGYNRGDRYYHFAG